MYFNPDYCRNESEVGSKLIVQYLLPRLGYSPANWHQEVTVGNIRLDFLACGCSPRILKEMLKVSVVIETKHPQDKLDRYTYRLKHYLNSLKVRYGLLTNARELRIYERVDREIILVFQCLGKEIGNNLEEIRSLIGRDSLTSPQVSTLTNPIVNPSMNTQKEENKSMKTLAIYHHKGGVGKTTVAVNLAAAFSKQGKKVLLIDIDAQANSTFATGLIKFQFDDQDDLKDKNVSHLLEGAKFGFIPEIVRKSQGFNQPEFDVIPSHITLIDKMLEFTSVGATRSRLKRKLDQVKDQYDIVIIDTPPSRDLYAEVSLIAADYLLIPSDLKPFSNQGLTSVKNFVEKNISDTRDDIGKKSLKIIGVLPSKISTHAKYLRYTFPKQRDVVPEHYNLPLMETIISERMCLAQCLNQNIMVGDLEIPNPQSIFDYAERKSEASISAAEFEVLASEVLEKMEDK